jgi:hypothetical protein
MNADRERPVLTREQKMGAVFLFAFAILAVGMGLLQLRNTIYGPFVLRPNANRAQVLMDETARLQQIDTDHDGLNDYEEIHFYETSPYLPDTDSDGIGDREELDAGTDPLCAESAVCATAEAIPTVSTTPDSIVPGGLQTPLDILGAAATAGSGQALDINTFASNPALLRILLLQSGKLTEQELKSIDDATLLEIAKKILAESATSTPR